MSKNLIIGALVIAIFALGAYILWPSLTAHAPTEPSLPKEENGSLCIQVITPARNPQTGEIREFPTPCDVPDTWEVIQNDVPGLDLEVQ